MFQILKDVPLPAKTMPAIKASKYPFANMHVGDMFFVPHKNKNTLSTHASVVGKRLGFKFSTRMVTLDGVMIDGVKTDDVTGIGVWRTK